MPFRALADGRIVTPPEVPDYQAVECPECSGTLYPRDGESRARHFVHQANDAANYCSAASEGESDIHTRCVLLAVATLAEKFPDARRCSGEVPIDASDTFTPPGTRRADALVGFAERNEYFGRGLIVEVQHKHPSKDVDETAHDYLAAGYSVVSRRRR